MKIKRLTDQEIVLIENKNAALYQQASQTSSLKISRNKNLKGLVSTFNSAKKSFLVKDYGYREELTGLTSCKFFNTLSYLEQLTSPEIAFLFQEQELIKLNQHFLFVFRNGQKTLFNAKDNLMGESALIEADYQLLLNQYYLDYVELICFRLAVFLTKLISIYQALYNHDQPADVLMNFLEDATYEFFNDLTFKATKILKGYLQQLYQKYRLNPEKLRKKTVSYKKTFADFDTDETFFVPTITSEEEALVVLGLTTPVSWKQIQASYHQLAKQYHPDLHHDDQSAYEQMALISSAYNYLKKQRG